MNKLLVIAVPIAVLLFASAWAQETDPAQDISAEWAAERAQRAENQARLDGLMGTMAKEMADIRATKNRKKREALMATHREHMREAMGLMRSMGGMHMREVMAEHAGPGMKQGMDMGSPQHMHKRMNSSGPHPEMTTEDRLSDLENRMDMMHVMMESMMEVDAKR